MAQKRKPSPTNEEIERIAEAINNLDIDNQIKDRDSFDLAFEDYFEEDEKMKNNKKVKSSCFNEIQKLNPKIIDIRLFKKADGKDLKLDRRKTAKRIVLTKKEYIHRKSKRVDLEGYDTKPKRKLIFVGKTKKKIVYTSKEYIIVKGHSVLRYRDRLGRFASVKQQRGSNHS